MGDLLMLFMVLTLELDVRIPGGDTSSSISVTNLCLVTGLTILAPTLGFSFPLLGGLGMRVWDMVCLLVMVPVVGGTLIYPDHLGLAGSSLSTEDVLLLGVELQLWDLEGEETDLVEGGTRSGLLGVLGLGIVMGGHG